MPQPFAALQYLIEDGKGDTSPITVYLEELVDNSLFPGTTATLDTIKEFAKEMWDRLQLITNGGNTVCKVILDLTSELVGVDVPAAISDVQEIGKFVFKTAEGFTKTMGIPAFLESKLVAGSKEVDLTDADVAAVVTAMTDGLDMSEWPLAMWEPIDSRGDDIATISAATEAWGKSRK